MTDVAQSAGQGTRPGVTDTLASAMSGLLRRFYGSARGKTASTQQRPDGEAQTPEELLQLREALARDWIKAKHRRDMRTCHQIEKDLREVTLKILGRGR